MKYIKNMYTILGLSILAATHSAGHAESSKYHQELKNLKKSDLHKTILDRQAHTGLRMILGGVENAKELRPFYRLLRSNLFAQGALVVTQERMPQLYEYVDALCKQQKMRTPTILITRNKPLPSITPGKYFETNSCKVLASSGAILISRDLLSETSEKAIEAALAYEIAHIKYNHGNKTVLVNWIAPYIVGQFFRKKDLAAEALERATRPIAYFLKRRLFKAACWMVPRMLISKRFEQQADMFVYKTMDNAEGLIEFCKYLQHKEERRDTDYADTRASLKTAKIPLTDYLFLSLGYHFFKTGHKMHNAFKWIAHNTFLNSYQSNEARIKAAQDYLNKKDTASA